MESRLDPFVRLVTILDHDRLLLRAQVGAVGVVEVAGHVIGAYSIEVFRS